MFKKFVALLLVLTLTFACAINGFAAQVVEVEKEEETPERQLIPVHLSSPPYGTRSDYMTLQSTTEYSTFLGWFLGNATVATIAAYLETTEQIPADLTMTVAQAMYDNLLSSQCDPYANNESLWVTQYRYTSRYPDAVRIVREYYADSGRTVEVGTVEFYIMYI